MPLTAPDLHTDMTGCRGVRPARHPILVVDEVPDGHGRTRYRGGAIRTATGVEAGRSVCAAKGIAIGRAAGRLPVNAQPGDLAGRRYAATPTAATPSHRQWPADADVLENGGIEARRPAALRDAAGGMATPHRSMGDVLDDGSSWIGVEFVRDKDDQGRRRPPAQPRRQRQPSRARACSHHVGCGAAPSRMIPPLVARARLDEGLEIFEHAVTSRTRKF